MKIKSNNNTLVKNNITKYILITLIFAIAFAIRLHKTNDPTLDLHATRQFRSYILTRGMYLKDGNEIPGVNKDTAILNMDRIIQLEPPVMENLANFGYKIYGGEALFIPRLISSFFWILGGIFLFFIAGRFLNIDGQIFSTAFYLFLPFGVTLSKSFQPDSLMICLMLLSILFIMKYCETQKNSHLAGIFFSTSLALIVKPVCIFMICGTAIPLYINNLKQKNIGKFSLPIILLLSFLPMLAYYLYGIFIAKSFLSEQANGSFIYYLPFTLGYWKGWISIIGKVFGYSAFITALTGIFFFKNEKLNVILGLYFFYLLFGLVFNYHIHTHDYYQLQFIPFIAICMGMIFQLITGEFIHLRTKRWQQYLLISILISGVILFSLVSVAKYRPDFSDDIRIFKEIGNKINHDKNSLLIAGGNRYPLYFYGNISAIKWVNPYNRLIKLLNKPESKKDHLTLFNELTRKYKSPYFIIEDREIFNTQPELKKFLNENYKKIEENKRYMIYNLKSSTD